jgi:signal transduction histidine kinase
MKEENNLEILVVEDSPTQAAQLHHILEMAGFKVSGAGNGKEALNLLQGGLRPTLVISDILMPEMDGYELCRRLRADERFRVLPVILVTTLSDPKDVIKGLECGANNFIIKPYDEKYLLNRIHYLLSNFELRKNAIAEMGINVLFSGENYFITAERLQILDLLLSTYENAYYQNIELIKAQNELRELNERLEELVMERTSELVDTNKRLQRELEERKRAEEEQARLQEQLRQSQKMEAVGLLAGGIAHDFNNLLMAIVSYGGILQMKMTDDDPLRPNVDNMLDVVDRAAGLTQGLLAFSRKQVINLRPVNLNEIIGKTEKFLARIIGEDIEFQTTFREDPLVVTADSGQIEQVLMNLATNARDAMPQGGSLSIITESTEIDSGYIKAHGYGEPGRYALLSVIDSGTGMDAATTKRIFEPFFTTKEVGKGTGLGLAVVYGIVKQHGGYINVYSEQGSGTTFRICLPLLKGGEHAGVKPTSRPKPTGGTETILLAEDDEELRQLAKYILTEFGYTVIEAVDGEDAVSRFTEHRERIQLLLLDLIMPKKKGNDACDEIRKMGSDVPAIFISGYPRDVLQGKGFLEEGCELIMKPVNPQNLLRTIRAVLDGQG